MPAELDSLLTFVLDLLRDYGLDDFYLELSTRDPEKFVGADAEWEEATETAPASRGEAGPRPRHGRGRCRLLRTQDLGAGQGRHRTHLADVDDPGRLPAAAALRAGVPGRRRHPPAAGDDPPRALRVDRALLRGAPRALCRGLPCLARSGAGRRHPDLRRARRLPARGRRRSCAREGIRVEVDASDDRMQKKIRTAQKQKVPYMLLAGDEDAGKGAVSFRFRDGTQENGVPVADAVARIVADVAAPRLGRAVSSDRHGIRLWAPDRLAYIQGENRPDSDEAGDGCPFCRAPSDPERVVAGGRPRRARLRRPEPLPVQPRARTGLHLPSRGRLRRPDRRRGVTRWPT